ncbi:hypothetical protein L6452_08774 [Arctium lappa]|uniref:Uncharacterized protein n=1 Tax=Arctium lappa TaxID=4217 RepID=A0ACB9DI84_ARCLA|nr:hypothetical protein L6452_08774 [Arctium lappa]
MRVPATKGVHERGVKSKNIERGTGGGQTPRLEATGSQENASHLVTPAAEESLGSETESDPTLATDESDEECIPCTTADVNDESDESDANVASDTNDGDDTDDDQDDQGDYAIQDNVDIGFVDFNDNVMDMDIDSIVMAVIGDIRSDEGAVVENMNVYVSHTHEDISHNLSSSHLESSGIETREHQPQFSLPLSAPLSLVSFDLPIIIPKAHIDTSLFLRSLSDLTRTPRVAPAIGLQRLGGSLVIATTLPTMSTDHAVASSTVMTTESLRDSGVRLPDFVSQESLDGALKVIENRLLEKFTEEIGGVKRLLKGKGLSVDPEQQVLPKYQTQPQPTEMSIDELKSLLFAKLLSQALDNQADADIFTLLQYQHQTPPPLPFVQITAYVVRSLEVNSFKVDVLKSIEAMQRADVDAAAGNVGGGSQFVKRDNVDHGEMRNAQCDVTGKETVLYMNPNVELRVAKPKYEQLWKVKKKKKENFMDVCDVDVEILEVDSEKNSPEDLHLSPIHNDVLDPITIEASVIPNFKELRCPYVSDVVADHSSVADNVEEVFPYQPNPNSPQNQSDFQTKPLHVPENP